MKVGISAVTVVRNEEKNIRRCLESVRWADEIVVMDQSSTDKTVSICGEYTDKIFTTDPKGYADPDRTVAVSKAKNEWVLYIDGDEEVSKELEAEIKSLLSDTPECGSYYIPRKNIFLGRWIKGSGWYPGYALRLFRKNSVKSPGGIHVGTIPLGEYGYLKNHIFHYTCDDLKEYIKKSDRYIAILASQAYSKGEKVYAGNFLWKLAFLPAAYFLHRFILKLGIRDGFRGFLIALLTFRTIFCKNIRLLKMQKGAKT